MALSLPWACSAYGPSAHTTAKQAPYTSRYQDIREDQIYHKLTGGARSTKTSKDGVHLGRSRGGSSWQIQMASECDSPMGDFTFWLRLSLRLSLSLNFGLSTYLSQKVRWFRWAKTWWLTRIV